VERRGARVWAGLGGITHGITSADQVIAASADQVIELNHSH
jgi:hypothetical protein